MTMMDQIATLRQHALDAIDAAAKAATRSDYLLLMDLAKQLMAMAEELEKLINPDR